jgi:dipeptidyl aminopeptidase/acylaminoacyl peptidase
VRHAAYSDARISPDGRYLAISVSRDEKDVLAVLSMSDLSVVHVNVLPGDKSVASFRWISDERLVFTAVTKIGTYAAPMGTGEWYAVNADGSQPEPFIFYGARAASERRKQIGNERYQMLDSLIDENSRDVMMSAYYPRSSEGAGVVQVRVNTVTGDRREIARAPSENCSLVLDEKKEARWAVCSQDKDEAGNFDIHSEVWRRAENGSWSRLNSSVESGLRLSVVGTADDGTIYALQGDGKAPEAFGTLAADGSFQELVADPVAEVSDYVVSPLDGRIIAVITEAGAPKVTLVDEDHPDAVIYSSLSQAFPGQLVDFESATRDGRQVVVSVRSDRNPGELYLYDRETGQARFLMKRRAWIDTSRSATVRAFRFTSRDGMTIHGYLTIPAGSDGRNLPMIVNPHGGPMGPRDSWGYNGETQLFASRGYAVLQVNFRGSGGYGKAFQDLAYGNWATGIMNDILDATHWAIDQGHADRDRICIYGGSFGGYAAMMAPAREPGLFKCAFGYVGAYSAAIQMRLSDTSRRESGRRYMARSFGSTAAEQHAMSPVNHADKLRDLPVFLAAGARDPRCPPENTEAMRDALIAVGNTPEGFLIQSGEMHGFYGVENRVNLYTQMLDFFGRHIGGRVEVGNASSAD